MFSCLDMAANQSINDWFAPDTTQRLQLGAMVSAVDPYWGGGEFIYGKSNAALVKGDVCTLDESFGADKVANTANLGFSVYVAMNSMAISTYGWFQKSGRAVYRTNATVAADAALGITAAGILGANTAGKQILGIRNRIAATGTLAKTNVQKKTGSAAILTNGYDGWFVGMALSGTGVPASTIVAKLDPDGRTVYMGSAIGTVDKLSTTTDAVTVTGTYTGYGSGIIEAPFAQGAIT